MESYLRAFRSVFSTPGWWKQMLLYLLVSMVPLVGPFVAMGWMFDRVARVASGDEAVPSLDFRRHMGMGFSGLLGIIAWAVIASVTLGFGSLVIPAFMAEFAATGRPGAFFDFGGVLGKLRNNIMAYLGMLLKVALTTIPLSVLYSVGIMAPMMSLVRASAPGQAPSPSDMMGPLILSSALTPVFLLASFVMTMAFGYWYGEYYRVASGMAPAAAPRAAVGGLTPLTIAAGVVGTDDDEFELPASLQAPAQPAPPSSLVATFAESAASLSLNLPGQGVFYEGGSFQVPSLGKTLTADDVVRMDAAGILLWHKPELRAAVLQMASKA